MMRRIEKVTIDNIYIYLERGRERERETRDRMEKED
jgi:hypothetical protein